MIYKAKYTVRGDVDKIEIFRNALRASSDFLKISNQGRLIFNLEGDELTLKSTEIAAEKLGLKYFKVENAYAESVDFDACAYVYSSDISWIDDSAAFSFDGDVKVDQCRSCGSLKMCGSVIKGQGSTLSKSCIHRFPPNIMICNDEVRKYLIDEAYTGVKFIDFLDVDFELNPSIGWFGLAVRSINKRMSSRSFKPNNLQATCRICYRNGFELNGWYVYYKNSVLRNSPDIFYSREWLAPHHVPTPILIMRKEIAFKLTEFDKRLKWLPVVSE